MREFLFRAQTLKDRRWVYGDLISSGTDPGDGEVRIMYWDDESGWMQEQVDPKTVGQFTGCLDKKGMRVFEGDIVDAWSQGSHTRNGLVRATTTFGFFILLTGDFGPVDTWQLAPGNIDQRDESLLVVGNRYDQPELIQGYLEWVEKNNS